MCDAQWRKVSSTFRMIRMAALQNIRTVPEIWKNNIRTMTTETRPACYAGKIKLKSIIKILKAVTQCQTGNKRNNSNDNESSFAQSAEMFDLACLGLHSLVRQFKHCALPHVACAPRLIIDILLASVHQWDSELTEQMIGNAFRVCVHVHACLF